MGYINHPERFRIFPFVSDSLKIFQQMGYKIIVLTNQSGVARGYFDEKLVKHIHRILLDKMKQEGSAIDGIYYCPHHPTEGLSKYRVDCQCRKPKPGMVLRALEDHDLQIKGSYMVGDRYKDIIFAKQLNLRSALVLTGYGRGEYEYQRDSWEIQPDLVGNNLLDIARQINVLQKNHPNR